MGTEETCWKHEGASVRRNVETTNHVQIIKNQGDELNLMTIITHQTTGRRVPKTHVNAMVSGSCREKGVERR